jgi:FtsP/CotA-like multicopper oxidase with cupredoxin domain/Cu/Ag efflux protein CusF
LAFALGGLIAAAPTVATSADHWPEPVIAGTSAAAITLGRDLDGDGDPDEIDIRLEIIEVEQEVFPGEFVTFWVFSPEGQGMAPAARVPSPTIRVEEGDRVRITLLNTHYFPHTIHLHGTIHPNDMDGVPEITQPAVKPGESFTYEFIAKNPGTHFYHCHVQPDVHVAMGLVGMLIIEPNRANNNFAHLVPGAGRIQDLAAAAFEHYDREYSLVYMDIDSHLNAIPAAIQDPREIEFRMHREYDTTQAQADIFLLNGRSFPYTLRDTPIEVKSGENVRLRILNAGQRVINLHTHGHHPTLVALDGYELPEAQQYTRDVFTIGAAQRIDLLLRPGSDDRYASGPGVWIMHDHTERTVTNRGISPGGDITTIVYDGFMTDEGLPRVATSLDRFFDPEYYAGNVPVFDPAIFNTTPENYGRGWQDAQAEPPAYPVRPTRAPAGRQHDILEGHQIVANSCEGPLGFRRIEIKAGIKYAREGEVFAFDQRVIRAEPCEEVEIVMENTDEIRHAFMLPGLNPMYTLEFSGKGTLTARFVTPAQNVTLEFHCHVEGHEKMGMHGTLVVGLGGDPEAEPAEAAVANDRLFEGVGVLLEVRARDSRIVVDHEEIENFMAAMVMSYMVVPATLLQGLEAGDKVRFTIDADQRVIVNVVRLE